VSVPATPTIAPPDLHAKVSAEGVELSATSSSAPGAAASGLRYFYRIYRQEKGSDTSAVAGEIPWSDSLEYVDHGFSWEKTYLYRVTVVTAIAGSKPPETLLEGNDSAQVEIFAHDVFPPAVPSGLQAVSSSETKPAVDLVWSPDADDDLDGYNVYRSEDGGAAVKVNLQLIKTPTFRDGGVKSGKSYSYSVSAVDVRGNESARSKEASESAQ
jgi:chitin-binding protein